jgi:phenylacetate-CoA ligase
LDNVDYIENYIVEVSSNEIGTDQVLVHVGAASRSRELMKDLQDRFRAKLRVAPDIQFKEIDEIKRIQFPEEKRKPIKFIDKRS